MAIVKKSNKSVKITIPDSLTEDTIESIHAELKKIDFNKNKSALSSVNLDLSEVISVDFFGFQHLFAFFDYLKNTLKISNLELEAKSEAVVDFENKMGIELK